MIKENELRIGNLVLSDGYVVEIEDIDKYSGITTSANWEGNISGDIKPIPLTEEWLVNMGFVMHEGNNYYKYWIIGENFEKGFEVTFAPISQEIKFCFTPRKTDNRIDFVIKHVHQLQNLYFALTEEELMIK